MPDGAFCAATRRTGLERTWFDMGMRAGIESIVTKK
jgi:hypothetical protein